MKKVKLLCLSLFCLGVQSMIYAQTSIRWGSTKNPLEGLTISWTNTTAATTDQIKWGYTTAYENGTSNVVSRAG